MDLAHAPAAARPTRKRWPNGPRCSPRATRWAAAAPGSAITTSSVLVRDAIARRALDDAAALAAAALADTGAIAVREDINLEPAFWGQIPRQRAAYLVRRALISTANMASFGSLHGFPLGQATGNHWGDAVTLLETTSATPFFFNFHHGDLGNFTVIGPSGSGKTVVHELPRRPGAEVQPAHDPVRQGPRRRSCSSAASAGATTASRAGEPTGFNPLRAARHRRPTARSCGTGSACCSRPKGPRSWRRSPPPSTPPMPTTPSLRRLRYFRELLAGARRPQPGDLADRLDAVDRRRRARLAVRQRRRPARPVDHDVLGFDMTALLDTPRLRTPVDDVPVPPHRRAARRASRR